MFRAVLHALAWCCILRLLLRRFSNPIQFPFPPLINVSEVVSLAVQLYNVKTRMEPNIILPSRSIPVIYS